MKNIIATLISEVKSNLVNQGQHIYSIYWFKKGEEFINSAPLVSVEGEEFDEQIPKNFWLGGAFAKKLGADLIVITLPAAYRDFNGKEIDINDITEDPSTFPKSMRFEAIVLVAIDLINKQKSLASILYKGGEGEPIKFEEDLPEEHAEDTAMAEDLMDIALDGWDNSDNIDLPETMSNL